MGNKKDSTVLWWVGWIAITILSFFVSCAFWTWFIARHVGTMHAPGVQVLWVTAVFGSWMVLLVPLIIIMYSKVDKAYEDARIARETQQFSKAKQEFKVRYIEIDESERALDKNLTEKLKKVPETIRRGHLVNATLKNGRKVGNVFILNKKDVLGIYGVGRLSFEISDIVDIEPVSPDKIPDFKTEDWLRLDGIGTEKADH